MHCNLRPPEPCLSFSALITTPCQVWSRWTYPLPYYSLFSADTLPYAVTLTFVFITLTFDLEHSQTVYRLCRDAYQIWTHSTNPRRSYSDFSIWPYDLKHVLRIWDNFHQLWPSTTYQSMNYSVFSERELMFMFAISRRPSVCRLSSVCNVRVPYSTD